MNMLGMEKSFKFKELTHTIIGAGFEVYNTLGYGYLEKVYENALVVELKAKGIPMETQKEMVVTYKGIEVGRYVADIIVESTVVVEVKSVEILSPAHEAQLLNYLNGTGLEVGLLMNFGKQKLEYKRMVL
jgi:GxxExxY protein